MIYDYLWFNIYDIWLFRLVVREDGQGDVCVADLTEILVDTKSSLEVNIEIK